MQVAKQRRFSSARVKRFLGSMVHMSGSARSEVLFRNHPRFCSTGAVYKGAPPTRPTHFQQNTQRRLAAARLIRLKTHSIPVFSSRSGTYLNNPHMCHTHATPTPTPPPHTHTCYHVCRGTNSCLNSLKRLKGPSTQTYGASLGLKSCRT